MCGGPYADQARLHPRRLLPPIISDSCSRRAIMAFIHRQELSMAVTQQEVFDYHRRGRPGKIEVVPTKAMQTQRDLSLAYTPGVAMVVEELERNPARATTNTLPRQ